LKKRSKKLLDALRGLEPAPGRGQAPSREKFFGSFFQKRTASFRLP
jgi:hypothetical protein